ncbi:alpha-D-ribose 1-methylphosphonate 5-triphosphate diphosphatase [Marinomonas sp. C2222]|uniref:Alpha-D-ribose 1-methylphosphonate 5-triphosphate diphosphatase n=1 Tax=Marinomonas sargassi TaxID=2984494 RepID=A0ABT2YPL1_9GAMM|nr:alpha-D-ribose 1-methylphosphonate 5-triphosphate diphosphatase [Marinomonas sargassi]MCV2401826.1 alpha-D-ribose 1-methylphosphonate 5-triphosphate diphosphatase [Marinomonas sargassi]
MILTNAQIVLADEVIKGTLVIKDGVIDSIDHGNVSVSSAIDCNNGYVTAGMVELHTDNMEKHFTPRPGVRWPAMQAFKVHDAQMASAGITSVFDAISIGDVIEGSERLNNLTRMVGALNESRERGLTRADHFLHFRCEVSHQDTLENFNKLMKQTPVQLVSVMDHSPGQRQFAKMDKYREYYQGKYKLSDAEMEAFITRQVDASAKYSSPFRKSICETCHELNIPLASHDDATLAHVEESHDFNMVIAEFPTTAEAAHAAHKKGMSVLMGAPNVVRGGSHSGNIAAHELASAGVLDVLSSDYYPASLLESAFMVAHLESNDYDIPKAMRLVSLNPAKAVGLNDRGEIAIGKKADLIWSTLEEDHVHIEQVWKSGQRAF